MIDEIGYKDNPKSVKVQIQEQIQPENEEPDYDFIFDQISIQLSSNNADDIRESLFALKDLDKNSFSDRSFFFFEIPKLLTNCLTLELPKFLSESLFDFVYQILLTSDDLRLFQEFEKNGIIEAFHEYYMNDQNQIRISLQLFSCISQKTISGRNKILKIIDIQFFCFYDDEQIIILSYQLILDLCTFALSTEKCDSIITVLQNGINSKQYFAYDLIFQSFYKISFVQEKNWYSIISSKHIDIVLLQFFNESEYKTIILLILKRIIEIYFIMANSLLNDHFNAYFHDALCLIFDFLPGANDLSLNDENNIFIDEEESIEVISDIFLLCAENNFIESLLDFNIVDTLILLSENGNFHSKINSVHCLTKLYKFIIKSDIDDSYNIMLAQRIVDIFIQFLSLPQQDVILYALISLINILNDSQILGIVDDIFIDRNDFFLVENLEDLQLNEDSLIVEKAKFLLNQIQSLN